MIKYIGAILVVITLIGCDGCKDEIIIAEQPMEPVDLCITDTSMDYEGEKKVYIHRDNILPYSQGIKFSDSIVMNAILRPYNDETVLINYLTFEVNDITLDTLLREQIRLFVPIKDSCSLLTPLDITNFSSSMIDYKIYDGDLIDARYKLDNSEMYFCKSSYNFFQRNIDIEFSCKFSLVESNSLVHPEKVSFSNMIVSFIVP